MACLLEYQSTGVLFDTICTKSNTNQIPCWSVCEQQNNSKVQTQQEFTAIKQFMQWKSFSALQTILLTTILRANKLKILVLLRIVSYRNELSDLLLLQQVLFLLYYIHETLQGEDQVDTCSDAQFSWLHVALV